MFLIIILLYCGCCVVFSMRLQSLYCRLPGPPPHSNLIVKAMVSIFSLFFTICVIHDKCQGMRGILPDLVLPPTTLPLSSLIYSIHNKSNCAENILIGIIVL